MAKNRVYVVWAGRETGLFHSWEECEKQVKGYAGASFKGYSNEEDANKALKESLLPSDI